MKYKEAKLNSNESQGIGEIFFKFQRLFGFNERKKVSCCGITVPQCFVLLTCKQNDLLSMKKLSESLGVDQSTITRVVDKMVKNGLLKRIYQQSDRRTTKVVLTQAGKRKVKDLQRCYQQIGQVILQQIPEREKLNVINSMKLLISAIEKMIDKELC